MNSAEQPTLQELVAKANRMLGMTNTGGNAQTITVTANAGVFGVWVATTACLVMLACGVMGALWVSREFQRYDTEVSKLQARDKAHEAYIQSIWREAPQLKPKDAKANGPG